jgi:hypothetical protein
MELRSWPGRHELVVAQNNTKRYYLGIMAITAKSSVTLPIEEIKRIEKLKKRLAAKSNVEVVRQGLRLLESSLDREELRAQFKLASQRVVATSGDEMRELDALSHESLDDEN